MSYANEFEYVYEGPVMMFDRIIDYHWVGKTYAPSAKKARSNLAYQYKKQSNKAPTAKITLPGNVTRLGGKEDAS